MNPNDSRCVATTFQLFEDGTWLCVDRATDLVVGGPVTEDMPAWDCHTMGNRDCGTTTTLLPDTSIPAPAPPTLDAIAVGLVLLMAVLVGKAKER